MNIQSEMAVPPVKCRNCGQSSSLVFCPDCGRPLTWAGWFFLRVKGTAQTVLLWLTWPMVCFDMFLLVKVVPTFNDVFASFGAKLPWPTEFVVHLSYSLAWLQSPFTAPLLILVVYFVFLVSARLFWEVGLTPVILLLAVTGGFCAFIMAALFMPMIDVGNVVK